MTKITDKEMMKEDINKRIKELLALYYDGETSPEQVKELAGIFKDAGELTPDLEEERRIFLTIEGNVVFDERKIPVPAALEKRLADAIDGFEDIGTPERRSSRGFLRRFAVASAAAAVIIITLTIGWKAMNIVSDTPDLDITATQGQSVAITEQTDSSARDSNTSSLASDSKADKSTTEVSQPEPEAKPTEAKTSVRRKAPRLNNSRNMAYTTPSGHKTKARIHVITDPEEACMFIDKMHTRIRKNINEAEMTSAKTGDVIESINRIVISNDL